MTGNMAEPRKPHWTDYEYRIPDHCDCFEWPLGVLHPKMLCSPKVYLPKKRPENHLKRCSIPA